MQIGVPRPQPEHTSLCISMRAYFRFRAFTESIVLLRRRPVDIFLSLANTLSTSVRKIGTFIGDCTISFINIRTPAGFERNVIIKDCASQCNCIDNVKIVFVERNEKENVATVYVNVL